MRNIKIPADYLTKDYEGFRQSMIDSIPTYTPEWTDTSQTDFGVVLIEMLAHGLDVLSYYQDKVFTESFLVTAETKKAVVNHARGYGYKLEQQVPTIHKMEIKKKAPFKNRRIVIPAYTRVGTAEEAHNRVEFEFTEDVVLEPKVEVVEGYVIHGETVYSALIGSSNGLAEQKFLIPDSDTLINSIILLTEEGGRKVRWEIVDDFLQSGPTDRHILAHVDEYNRVEIEFGNGISGRIPELDSPIEVSYRVGGGTIGNIGKHTITEFLDEEFPEITITNTEIYREGVDLEDIQTIKKRAPKAFFTGDRAVTKGDFELFVQSVAGVADAKAVEQFTGENELKLYVSTADGEEISEGLKKEILDVLERPRMVNVIPKILTAEYIDFNIDVDIYIYDAIYKSEVKPVAEKMLKDLFNISERSIGEPLYLMDILKSLGGIYGVRNVSIKEPLKDLEITETQIVRLQDVTVRIVGGLEDGI